MKIFISYRRDDTAGRAGRLFDQLVSRFGARNVFQDVAAIAPGADFDQQVGEAIAQSDAALVVIGANWLTMRAPDGTPRLDQTDDYVRREVGAALSAGVRVVPVLVDDAELPTPELLPEPLRPLTHRQAVVLRDSTWHQDVDALVRRLEGEQLVETRPRRWPYVVGAVVALLAVVIGGWIWSRDDDGEEGSDDEVLTGCPAPDGTWTEIPVSEGATVVEETDPHRFEYTVQGAHYRPEGAATAIIVRAQLANATDPVDGTHEDDIYFSEVNFDALLVDGLSVGEPQCFSIVAGDQNIEPAQRAIANVGFGTTEELTGTRLVLQTDGDQDIEITPAV